jgi:hypothetical protein
MAESRERVDETKYLNFCSYQAAKELAGMPPKKTLEEPVRKL